MIDDVTRALAALPYAKRTSTKDDKRLQRKLNRAMFRGLLINGHDKSDADIQFDEYVPESGQTIIESLRLDTTWIDFMRKATSAFDGP